MSDKRFDKYTQSLLLPITTNEDLRFQSHKTGEIFESGINDTLLVSEGIEGIDITSKYRKTIITTAFEPINHQIRIEGGCSKCK